LLATSTPDPQFVGTGCTGGSSAVVIAPGGNQLELKGAGIAANTTCEIQVNVTSEYAGNLINEIPIGKVTTKETVTNRAIAAATLVLRGNADLEVVSKDDGKTVVTPKQSLTYTIKVRNNKGDAVADVPVKDVSSSGLTIK
jgi:uncharacterized repeat protein (TIGR01451 family)